MVENISYHFETTILETSACLMLTLNFATVLQLVAHRRQMPLTDIPIYRHTDIYRYTDI